MSVVLKELNDVIGNYSGLARQVLEYTALMRRMVVAAKQPGFSIESWGPLAELIEVAEFERVGNFKEVMNWQEYTEFLTSWAMSSGWDCSFKRVTEVGNLVFLELEERSEIGEFKSVVNSCTVYEFNKAGKVKHLDVFLQMELPPVEMLQSYQGVV